MSYIYKITNDVNGKIYIGKTDFSIEKRWKEHLSDFQRKKYENRPLYKAMYKYGSNHFHIQLIEECSAEKAPEREKYWIEQYGSFKNGYNATAGGDGRSYVDVDLIYGLWDKQYNISEIHRITGYDCGTISTHLENYGISTDIKQQRGYLARVKPVIQKDKYTHQIINIFPSMEEAKRQLNIKNSSHISEVCQGKRKSAYGFIWEYL